MVILAGSTVPSLVSELLISIVTSSVGKLVNAMIKVAVVEGVIFGDQSYSTHRHPIYKITGIRVATRFS